jgi:hypothetical protein
MNKIQTVNLCETDDIVLYCPFSGEKVIDLTEENPERMLSPSSYTLFIATNDGFEYQHSSLGNLDESDVYNEISQLVAENSIIFTLHPSAIMAGNEVYIGF